MTEQDALIDLLARVDAQAGGAVYVTGEEMALWPAAATAAMRSQKLLTKARPAVTALCPGCERQCVMPIHTLTRPDGAAASFVVCDKRSDTNRVAIAPAGLERWRCDADAVSRFVAESLGVRLSEQLPVDGGPRPIGMARGKKRSQMLTMRLQAGLALVVGDQAIALVDLVDFQDGRYRVDAVMVCQMVDAATTADPRHTPSTVKREAGKLDTQARYASWQKAYKALRKKSPGKSDVWYSQQIAKTPIAQGRDASTIKKHMLA